MARIVLLEPDRILAEICSRLLQAKGHTVVPCASALAAVMAADTQTPDIVITELQLIGHSGIEFLHEFRSYPEWQPIPVIIHTSVPTAEFADGWDNLTRQLGITTYLYKPSTNLQKLAEAVDRSLVTA